MNRVELNKLLNAHLSEPQASERWAMYRVVAPIVDYANNSLKLVPYFEFNQTSEHDKNQSVDIALLDQKSQPRVLVEAKRWDRAITPEQIDKYLIDGVRAAVSNGILWVLCNRGQHTCLNIFAEGSLQIKALDAVIGFLRGRRLTELEFKSTPEVYRTTIKPWKIEKLKKATRRVHEKTIIASPNEFHAFVDSLEKSPAAERVLLKSIIDTMEKHGLPAFLKVEARKTRVSLFDDRREKRRKRVARIELGKQNPDVLVLTEIVDQFKELTTVVTPYIHDKGAHMRRFRIPDESVAMKFGQTLILNLIESQVK